VILADVRFHEDGDDEPFAVGWGTFMPSPGVEDVFPDGFVPELVDRHRLDEPLRERVRARLVEPGVVEMPRHEDGLNAIAAIQGGILTVAAEDAALSLAEPGRTLSSMSVRYLRPFLVGPARAEAERIGDVVLIRITDVGQGKLGAVVTARLSP
jgi:acyl-coenzyme A thioesterase PaaI-like protein